MVVWPLSKQRSRGATQRAPPRTEESKHSRTRAGLAALAGESVAPRAGRPPLWRRSVAHNPARP
eukprot:4561927-Prymnesium_polylepis.2